MDGYKESAIHSINIFNNFNSFLTYDEQTITKSINTFSNSTLLAPYATIENTGETYFSFELITPSHINFPSDCPLSQQGINKYVNTW